MLGCKYNESNKFNVHLQITKDKFLLDDLKCLFPTLEKLLDFPVFFKRTDSLETLKKRLHNHRALVFKLHGSGLMFNNYY